MKLWSKRHTERLLTRSRGRREKVLSQTLGELETGTGATMAQLAPRFKTESGKNHSQNSLLKVRSTRWRV